MSRLNGKNKWIVWKHVHKLGLLPGVSICSMPRDEDLLGLIRKSEGKPFSTTGEFDDYAKQLLATYPQYKTKKEKRGIAVVQSVTSKGFDSGYSKSAYRQLMDSQEWALMRYVVFRLQGRACRICNASPLSGEVMHVDHIEPASKNWARRLDLLNLQVLCSKCNHGKTNLFNDDWR